MSLLTPDEDRKWLPTHVQVTVLKGRGLRGKGKHGTSDVYTIIQLGKEKYSTCVVEKTTEPEWREECTFEVQPDALERGSELVLTVMHRALIGLDVFLGQAVIPLDEVFTASRGVKNQWYRLNSKTGKKEKERGEIQVTVQFTRNNLTASMYDLVMKDKGVSTFFKLKERIKGKRRSSEEDSSSAILPGGYGSLVRMRQRLPSDGGGEEYYEDDEGGEVRRSKMRTFFLRGKLRKSSDTRSSTSLGSESSESSSRGGSLSPTAGISVVVSDLSNSPSNSSNLTADNSPEHTANTSPKLTSPKCEFEDEAGEITIAVPQPEVCVNGSHSLSVQPLDSGKAALLGLGLLKPLPLSMSLQNLSPQDKDLPPCILAEGRRWSFDKPDAEEKAAIAAALEQSGPMQADPEEDGLDPASSCTVEANGHIQRRKEDSELASTEDRHKGWFGSKDLHNKPSHSPVMSLTDSHSPTHSWGSSVDSPGHLTNPFSPSPPLLSRSNPFFTTLHNPFFKDMSCTQPLNPSPPPLPFLSSARPPITTLFPEVNMQFSNLSRKTLVEKEEQTELNKMPKPSPSEQGMDSELDHSFDEFAAGRLQSPDDITPDSKTLQNTSCSDPPLDCDNVGNKETKSLMTHIEQTTCNFQNAKFACFDVDAHHFFTKLLDTIPENNLEYESKPVFETPQVNFDANIDISGEKFNCNSPDPSSSGLGSSAEDDGLSCFSSCSASDKLSSSEETEVHNFESSFEKNPGIKNVKTSESEEEFTDKSEDMSLDQQTVFELEVCSKGVDASSTKLDHTNPEPKPDVGASTAESECSTILPPVFITTSSPGLSDSLSRCPFESTNVAGQDQLSPFPVALFTDLSNTSSINPSPDASLLHANTSDRTSFAPSWYESVDSQEYKTCLTHPTSRNFEKSVNSTLFTEENCIQMANYTATGLDNAFPTAAQDGRVFGDLKMESFETNFTEMSGFALQSPKEVGADIFSEDINGLFFVKQINIQEGPNTNTEDFLKLECSSEKMIGQKGGFESDFNAFETSFTQPVEYTMHVFKREVPWDSRFSNNNKGLISETTNGEYFESSVTAVDDSILQSVPSPKQNLIVEDVFSKDPNGGYFDNWVGAKIESDYTAGTFNLQTTKEEVLNDISRNLFDSDVIFESNITAPDDFTTQSYKPEANMAHTTAPVFDNRDIFEAGFTAVDTFSLQSNAPHERVKAEHGTLQRSLSEGELKPALDELHPPAFGSDPELASSKPQPALLLFSPLTPSLTPQCSSSPIALCPPPPVADTATWESPAQQQQQTANQLVSPHPVKPLTTAAEDKKNEGRSMLEKLKFTRNTGKSSPSTDDSDKKKALTEGAGSYYHLTHSELVALLVQREAEHHTQKAEFERQKILLAKRETELKRLKPQVRDLEDYIDTLLVRIMEQKPTLLQVGSKNK
ncbi:unnamed protein product [Knipowitschia caucasica]